ncbi:MAG: hypothetical protein HY791_06720 [Deltaproteobacteria bacterium]|nr:hypothetical protein [Deltaproteobacteria bacterium]
MEVTRQLLDTLRKKAEVLAERVAEATRDSTNAHVRTEGGRFAEVLGEWLDQLDELFETEDPEVIDRVRSFSARLQLAEDKVARWGVGPTRTPKSRRGSGVRKAA